MITVSDAEPRRRRRTEQQQQQLVHRSDTRVAICQSICCRSRLSSHRCRRLKERDDSESPVGDGAYRERSIWSTSPLAAAMGRHRRKWNDDCRPKINCCRSVERQAEHEKKLRTEDDERRRQDLMCTERAAGQRYFDGHCPLARPLGDGQLMPSSARMGCIASTWSFPV